MKQWNTTSVEETQQVAQEIAGLLNSGDILTLHGDLGTGKTTLTKGIAKALGIEKEITSPTFTLMNVYPVHNPNPKIQHLVHIDTYRLETKEDLLDIGVEDYLGDPHTLTIIEWPEKITSLLEGKVVKNVFLEHTAEGGRRIYFK